MKKRFATMHGDGIDGMSVFVLKMPFLVLSEISMMRSILVLDVPMNCSRCSASCRFADRKVIAFDV